jgi:hypothetical protein
MRPQCGKVAELCSVQRDLPFGDGFCLCRKARPTHIHDPSQANLEVSINNSPALFLLPHYHLPQTTFSTSPASFAAISTTLRLVLHSTSKIKMREVISINGKDPSTRRTPLMSRVLNHITTFCTNASAPHSRPGRLPNCKLLLGGELQHNTMRLCRFVALLLMAGVTNVRGFHYSSTALSMVSRYVSSHPQCCRHRPRSTTLY